MSITGLGLKTNILGLGLEFSDLGINHKATHYRIAYKCNTEL